MTITVQNTIMFLYDMKWNTIPIRSKYAKIQIFLHSSHKKNPTGFYKKLIFLMPKISNKSSKGVTILLSFKWNKMQFRSKIQTDSPFFVFSQDFFINFYKKPIFVLHSSTFGCFCRFVSGWKPMVNHTPATENIKKWW